MVLRSPLSPSSALIGFLLVTLLTYGIREYLAGRLTNFLFARGPVCKTIVTDPDPPLNVRLSPVVASDNLVGSLKNGTELTVMTEQEDWLQISAPLKGWVSKDRTATICPPTIPR